MVSDSEIHEIGKELNIDKIEYNTINNVIPKLGEFGKSSGRNTHFIIPKYVPMALTTNFFCGFIPRKVTSFEEIILTPN